MDLNDLLLWLVGLSSAAVLLRTFRGRIPGTSGWKIVCGFLLAVVAAGSFAVPRAAGYIAAGCWCVLFLAPALGLRRLNRLVIGEDYERAASTARWLAWIHPFDDWRVLSHIYTALRLAQTGSLEAAAEILERYRHIKTSRARNAVAQLYRLQGRWADLLEWMRENVSLPEIERDPGLGLMRLRAWGETGQLDPLLAGFDAFDKRFHDTPSYRDVARLYLLTFFGKTDTLARLFEGPLRSYSEAIRARWLASARAAEAHLAAPPADLGAQFATLERDLAQEQRYGADAASSRVRPVVTYVLIAINVLAFAAETLLGGSMDDSTLVRLGALLPPLLTPAESWRLVTASFLHFGLLHLAMNMAGMLVLGPFVERILRGWRYGACYLGSGIGSMAVVVLMNRLGYVRYDLILGASGSIMGLVGATAAICLRDSRIFKTRAAAARLRWAASVILLQIVFDAATPQVSMTAHLGGVVTGFLLTLLLGAGR